MGACSSAASGDRDGGGGGGGGGGVTADDEAFLRDEWVPFLRELRRELVGVHERTALGFAAEERLPSQRRVLELAERGRQLAERRRGGDPRGRASAAYEWLVCAQAASGAVAYDVSELPAARSADTFGLALDGRARRALYGRAAGSRPREGSEARGPLESGGESPIDDLQVSNLMSPEEARLLLASGHVRGVLLRALERKQRKALARLSALEGGEVPLERRPPAEVREALRRLVETRAAEVRAAGVDADSLSFRTLMRVGRPTRSWGQLDKASQHRVRRYVAQSLAENDGDGDGDGDTPPPPELPAPEARTASPSIRAPESADAAVVSPSPPQELLKELTQWVRRHPGRYFRDDKALHKKLVLLAMWTDSLAVVRRSAIEERVAQRYVPLPWRRRVDLPGVDEDGKVFVLRARGSEEHSRFRANTFPYLLSHGLGVSSGGVAEGLDEWGTLAYEMGAGMPRDPGARLGNHFANDFEKAAVEAVALTPAPGAALPGEAPHSVAQNPAIGSSIAATQHTQVGRGTARPWPVLLLEARPRRAEALDATVDLVQLSDSEDAFFVRLRARRPDSEPVVRLLQEMRVALVRELGRAVDFSFGVFPEPEGDVFTAVWAPVAALEPANEQRTVTRNPLTGQRSDEAGFTRAAIQDVLTLRGAAIVFPSTADEPLVSGGLDDTRRLYTYTRVPGARAVVRRELAERTGYDDTERRAVVPPAGLAAREDDRAGARPVFSPLAKQAASSDLYRFVAHALADGDP